MNKIFKFYRSLYLFFLLLFLVTVYLTARNVLLKKKFHEQITPYISDEKERARIAREKYPEIDIVVNEEKGLWDKRKDSKIVAIHELTIGDDNDEENFNKTFYLPTPIISDDEGNIYIGESMGECKIRKFSPNGDYLLTIAGKGKGPGEFMGGSFAFDDNKDILFVVDYGNQRISQFTSQGRFLCSAQLSRPIKGTSFAIDNKEFIFISFYDKEIDKVIHKYNENGNYQFSFGDPVHYKKPLKIRDLPYIEMAAVGSIKINNDELLYSQCNPYEIRKYSKRGQLKKIILRKNNFLPPAKIEISKRGGYIYSVPAKSTFVGIWNGLIINCIWIPPHFLKKIGTVIDIFDQSGYLLTSLKLEKSISFSYMDKQGRLYGTCTHQENWPIVRYALKLIQ